NENIRIGNKGVIGYFDQAIQGLIEGMTILENVRRDCSFSESFVRINLDGFGFKGDSVFKRVEALSGGERVKVLLCKILLSDNNILVLDEPTNYLDIKAMEALECALANCDKTILIVSHDRSFLSKVCNYVLEIKCGEIFEFNGGFEEYERVKNSPRIDACVRRSEEEKMLLQNRLSEVISLLSIEKNENKRMELEKRYFELLEEKKNYGKSL
ncbi:MAG: ATP-binding cassette domain-containing protein, partial [Clostridium sp.]